MAYSSSNKYINWQIEVVQGTQEVANNRTYVTVYVKAWRTNTGYTTDGYGKCQLTVNGSAITDNTWSYGDGHALTYNSYTVLHSWAGWIGHNTDGTKTLSVSAYWGIGSSSSNWTSTAHATQTETYSITLTTIPRYFSTTPTLTYSSKTETSITYSWATSETCSQIQWKNNSGTVVSTVTPNSKSGTVTFSGLTKNTSYSYYGTFKRSDSGLTTDSRKNTQTTYDYPKVSGIQKNPLTIGGNQSVQLENPMNRPCKVYMIRTGGSASTSADLFYQSPSSITTNGSVSITPNASKMYASIPASPKGSATYYCTYSLDNESTYITSNVQKTGDYICDENTCKPTLSANPITYQDSSSVANITSNAAYLVQSKSICSVKIPTAATPVNNTSIDYYMVTLGSSAPQRVETNQINTWVSLGTVNTSNNISLSYYAVDKRGFPSSSSAAVTVNVIPWQEPSVTITQLERSGGNSPTVLLKINSSFSSININNTEKNSLPIHSYTYYKSGDTPPSNPSGDWTSGTQISITPIDTNYDYTFEISYRDAVMANCNIAAKTITRTVAKGVAILMIDPTVNGVGVNCFPPAAGLYVSGNRVVAITSGTTTPSAASGAIGDIYIQIS